MLQAHTHVGGIFLRSVLLLHSGSATLKIKVKVLEILTGICTKVPLLSAGCENNGTTGTDPFLMKIGPCIGVTAESFWSGKKEFADYYY